MKEDANAVCEMFNAISPTYDRVNRVVSFGIDQMWRKRMARELPPKEGIHLLDIATGTADQLIALMQSCPRITHTEGIDVAEEMLVIGREKLETVGLANRVVLKCASALALPVADNSVDCATITFGIRNVSNPLAALTEMHRVLDSEGRALILEFSLPANPLVRWGHLVYLRHLLPRIGGWISKNPEAYVYLNQTIEKFPYGEKFCALMRQAGFSEVTATPLTFGAATLYVGVKA